MISVDLIMGAGALEAGGAKAAASAPGIIAKIRGFFARLLGFSASRAVPNVSPTVAELRALGGVKGFQVHHILPEYLGKMMGFTRADMLKHPGTFISQWAHTGKLNPQAFHKAISKYLPPMVGGQRATYTAAQIRTGLQKAYSELGRSDLFGAIGHLFK